MRALKITPDSVEEIDLDESEDGDVSLDALQAAVGGWIETVPVRGGTGIINEEGKFKHLPLNFAATSVTAGLHPLDYIAGDMIVLGDADDEGRFTPVDGKTVAHLSQVCNAIMGRQ